MGKESLATDQTSQVSARRLTQYRIDPELTHALISADDPDIASRHAEFWDKVGPEYADIARNLGHKVAVLRQSQGDATADVYLEAATTILEAVSQQDDLDRKLA